MLGGISSLVRNRFLRYVFPGVGAGSCYVVAFAILRDVLDDQKRAKVLSMMNGITTIVPVLAPVINHLIMTVTRGRGFVHDHGEHGSGGVVGAHC